MIQEKKISDFAEVITGGTPSTTRKEYWEGGNIPWLNSGELNKRYIYESRNFITELGLRNSSTRLMPPDTVLIALTGATCGLSALSKMEACANQSVTGILPSKSHIPEYLFHFLRTQRQRILDKAWGNAQPHISQAFVKDFKIPLPSLPDQLQIANLLSKAENLIAQRKESIRLLDEFLKSTFLEMFGDLVSNEKGWGIGKFEDYTDRITKGESPKWQGFDYLDSGVRFVTSENVLWGNVDLVKAKYIHKDFHDKLKRSQLLEFDLLVNLVGASVGRTALCPREALPANINQAVAAITLKRNEINPLFVMHLFINTSFQRMLLGNVVEAARANLSLGDLRNLKLPIPPIELQNQFAQIVEKTEVLKSQYQQSLQELENMYGSLSQRAFRGELGVRQ
jgi:type I restriction enzyme S subunit